MPQSDDDDGIVDMVSLVVNWYCETELRWRSLRLAQQDDDAQALQGFELLNDLRRWW